MTFSKTSLRKNAAWLLILLGVAGLVTSGILLLQTHNSAPKPPPGVRPSAAPSSVKPAPAAVAVYNVAPDLPKFITIPAIGVPQTRVVGLGQLKNGQIATPGNIYDAGWYKDSSKPGQLGAMFIYGHVSSWTANGVFYNLHKLRRGDKITITRGDNTVFTYQVASLKTYPANSVDMNAVLSPVSPGTPGLSLMTCTGTVIKGTSEFTERLVVFTSLVH